MTRQRHDLHKIIVCPPTVQLIISKEIEVSDHMIEQKHARILYFTGWDELLCKCNHAHDVIQVYIYRVTYMYHVRTTTA